MDELALAADLPQADATSLVDRALIEARVRSMYRDVARERNVELHFAIGRELALRLGYPREAVNAVPSEAVASFAGVGYHLDLAALGPGDRVLDLGSGSGMDSFAAACAVGPTGRVVGVDFTDDQLAKAGRLRDRDGFEHVDFVEATIDELPFADATFDVVTSNGVINLSPVKHRVFAEAARVLRPNGRLAISDIVSGLALRERTRRDADLWAACVAGAIPRESYIDALRASGFRVTEVRTNDYNFISERTVEACSTYAIESISLRAVRELGAG